MPPKKKTTKKKVKKVVKNTATVLGTVGTAYLLAKKLGIVDIAKEKIKNYLHLSGPTQVSEPEKQNELPLLRTPVTGNSNDSPILNEISKIVKIPIYKLINEGVPYDYVNDLLKSGISLDQLKYAGLKIV